ncbi:CAMK family protein kinase [Tritrichomonas foetus]|uniref:CAMK family protein kinase n=1 Tax=Tritrichomonas foetus TaxID=1144522 RepID=A0A1J4JSU1_9EUKA|nr:CAMK family protein kinase [Tritrichomonas foetus]|eukprot:OHT02131.1 CAMK family protein kinase [Tritrichomonas foetus]
MNAGDSEAIKSERLAEIALKKHGYILQKTLGSGGYSIVYLARSRKYNSDFAIKQIRPKNNFRLDAALQELHTIMSLNHPNIIRIFNYFIESSNLYLVFEYCPGGSIQDIIDNSSLTLSKKKLIRYFRQIVEAIHFCQSKNIAHHDIKPGNILLDTYDRPKLADFGLSFKYETQEAFSMNFDGSLQFMAPELISRVAYDPFKADIWSLGITFYMMISKTSPWNYTTSNPTNKEELQKAIVEGNIMYPPTMKKKFVELLKKMLVVDISQRATMNDLLESFLFDEGNLSLDARSTPSFISSSVTLLSDDSMKLSKMKLITNISDDKIFVPGKEEPPANYSYHQFPRTFKHMLLSEMNMSKGRRQASLRTFSNIDTFSDVV